MQAQFVYRAKSQPALQCAVDSKTIRRQNLARLEREFGALAAIERATRGSVTASYLSQIKGGRGMGDALARKLERALGRPMGWMDQSHPQTLPVRVGSSGPDDENVTHVTAMCGSAPATFSIPLLEIEGSMGVGRVQPEYETIVSTMDVNQEWVRTQLPNISSPANLRVITGRGDSMQDTFEDGDILFVDTGYTEVRLDAVYAFQLGDELFIKRLQRHPDGTLTALSDNKRYEPYRIAHRQDVRVIGRVVGALNWRKL